MTRLREDHPMTIQTIAPNSLAQPAQPAQFGAVVQSEATALRGLDDWLRAAGSAEQLARQLVHSFFVPQAYKPGNPRDEAAVGVAIANATGAILLGQSLGLDPLTSLQQIYVVHGRPGMYSKMKVALAQAAGHRVWDVEYTAERCTVAGQRAGSEDVVTITITMEQAKQAGWTTNAAYQKTPADMLWARAASRVVDRIAADLLMGIRSIEDIDEPEAPARVSVTAADVKPAPIGAAAGRSASEALRGAPADAAPLAGLQAHGAVREAEASTRLDGETQSMPDATADGITDAQLRKLGAVMGDLGVTGTGSRERRLAIAARIAGRDLGSSKDLTRDEAHLIIDTLDGIARGDDVAVRLDRLERGLPIEPTADHQGSPSDPMADARSHAADVEARIAAARAEVDERAAQQAAEAEQAEAYDPTAAEEWPS